MSFHQVVLVGNALHVSSFTQLVFPAWLPDNKMVRNYNSLAFKHDHASAIAQLNYNSKHVLQVGVISTTVCVLDGINPPPMILIGRWPLARRLPLLQVQPMAKGVQVR